MLLKERNGRLNLWVTGGSGFLGRHVSKLFSSNGWQVSGIGRGVWTDPHAWGTGLWIEANVSDESLAALMERSGPPDAVFHAAGPGTVMTSSSKHRRSFEDTVVSTFELIEFLHRIERSPCLIYPSSCAVYGDVEVQPIPEDAPIDPISTYGYHKAMAEALCKNATENLGLSCGIIRYFSLYGRGLRKQFIWELATRIAEGDSPIELHGSGEEVRDYLHVEDAALLALVLVDFCRTHPKTLQIINGGTGTGTSISAVAQAVSKQLPGDSRIEFSGHKRPEDPSRYEASVERLRHLDFQPYWDLSRGLKDYCQWIFEALW